MGIDGVTMQGGFGLDEGPLLEVRDLRVCFQGGRVLAVDGVSLVLQRGEALGIVGESGCGKSTTLKAILRVLPASAVVSGAITLRGRQLLAFPEAVMRTVRGRDAGMIFQDPQAFLNPTLPIGRQITEPLLWHRMAGREEAKRRAIAMLASVGIPAAAQRFGQYPFEFSGGMLQRAMIARALICDPPLLLADEPTTALDVTVQAQILDLLRTLRQERGMSLILVTHDLAVATQVCDRILVMYSGHVVEEVRASSFATESRHPYSLGLLQSIPHLGGGSRRLSTIPGAPPTPEEASAPGCVFAPRCPYRLEHCLTERPVLRPSGRGRAACWRSDENLRALPLAEGLGNTPRAKEGGIA